MTTVNCPPVLRSLLDCYHTERVLSNAGHEVAGGASAGQVQPLPAEDLDARFQADQCTAIPPGLLSQGLSEIPFGPRAQWQGGKAAADHRCSAPRAL